MKRFVAGLLLCLVSPVHAQAQPAQDPTLAVVRIKSHGCSGTIIHTTKGKSWILSCAHMLRDHNNQPSAEARQRPFKIDGPAQPHAENKQAPARLVGWDYDLDLSLIEIDNGPYHYIPVARYGHKPGRNVVSLGYDEMKWPITQRFATLLTTVGATTYTTERPWHGRSGGGLIDVENRCLIGVVQGYECDPGGQVQAQHRGLYVSHDAILRFLTKQWQQPRQQPQLAPGGC